MDPASIVGLVAACSSLTKQCASVVKSLHGLIETYKSAELIILSVATECETIQFAWDRIETWAQQQLHHIDDFEDVGARLQKSIYCGELVMSALEEELVAIISKSSTPGRGISLTWNNSVLNEHQHRIRGQVAALQLLLQVLNLPRKEDRIEVLSIKASVFSESDESALSIVPSDRSTRYSLDGNRLSIISDDGDIQYIRFSFEDALFTSHVYKRNYRFPAMRTTAQGQAQPVLQQTDSQDEPVQFHSNASIGNTAEDVLSQSQTNAFEFGLSNESDSTTPDFLSTNPLSSGNITANPEPIGNNSAARVTLPDLPIANTKPQQRREKDKKTLLGRALQKANTAVLLDNAQNFTGAIENYEDACILVHQVIIRSSAEEDRKKLDAIRTTYRNRIEELVTISSAKNEDIISPATASDEGITTLEIGQAI